MPDPVQLAIEREAAGAIFHEKEQAHTPHALGIEGIGAVVNFNGKRRRPKALGHQQLLQGKGGHAACGAWILGWKPEQFARSEKQGAAADFGTEMLVRSQFNSARL